MPAALDFSAGAQLSIVRRWIETLYSRRKSPEFSSFFFLFSFARGGVDGGAFAAERRNILPGLGGLLGGAWLIGDRVWGGMVGSGVPRVGLKGVFSNLVIIAVL